MGFISSSTKINQKNNLNQNPITGLVAFPNIFRVLITTFYANFTLLYPLKVSKKAIFSGGIQTKH